MKLEHASNASELPPDRYVVNMVRDPFDLVVSCYEYHRQCPEAWTKMSLTDNGTGWVMWLSTKAGPLGHLMKKLGAAGLPPVLEKESYCQYLLRIDLTAGLLVESIRTMHRDIPYMLESKAKVLGRRGNGLNLKLKKKKMRLQSPGPCERRVGLIGLGDGII